MSARPRHCKFICGVCLRNHSVRDCEEFLEHNPTERYLTIFTIMSCTNCLSPNHISTDCRRKHRCYICKQRHHTLLHGAEQIEADINMKRYGMQQGHNTSSEIYICSEILLPTAFVKIMSEDIWIRTRAVINNSITTSKISRSLVERNNLKIIRKYNHLYAVFLIRSHNATNSYMTVMEALITDELPRKLYAGPINVDPTVVFPADVLADRVVRSNIAVEIEIGEDNYFKIRDEKVVETGVGLVLVEKSALGYVFYGPIK